MYEILVTGPLGTSECTGECRFSANLSVFNPQLSTNSLVLCGSWSEHDEQLVLEAFGGKYVDLEIIPLKTTKYAQLCTYISPGNIKYMPRE